MLTGFIPTESEFVPIYNLIERFGGVVQDTVDQYTTHCIAMYDGEVVDTTQFEEDAEYSVPETPHDDEQIITFLLSRSKRNIKVTDKVRQARNKVYLMPPEWIYLSCYSYCKLDERVYCYNGTLPAHDPLQRAAPTHRTSISRQRVMSVSSTSISDLDDLAEALENDMDSPE